MGAPMALKTPNGPGYVSETSPACAYAGARNGRATSATSLARNSPQNELTATVTGESKTAPRRDTAERFAVV